MVLIQSDSMPRPRAKLDPSALTRAFAPDGLHGTTSASVARSAGVAKPTVYAHAGSKEGAFLACVEAEVERLLSAFSNAELSSRSRSPRACLATLAEAIIEHGQSDPAAARLLHVTARHSNSSVAAAVDAALARLPARVASILRRHTTADCATRVAPAFFGAAAALALRQPPQRRAGSARAAAMLADAFCAVLEPTEDVGGSEHVQSVGVY